MSFLRTAAHHGLTPSRVLPALAILRRMGAIDILAATTGIAAFGLALYEAIGKGEYIAASACFAFVVLCSTVLILRRKAREGARAGRSQTQRVGKGAVAIQSGRDTVIGDDLRKRER